MKKIIATAALAAALAATPGLAQEEAESVGGFKLGAVVGLDSVTLDDGVTKGSEEGLIYGITAGYDAELGGAVIGVEAELAGSTTDRTETGLLVPGDTAEISAGRDIYLGLRLGAKVGKGIVYLKGGYTNAAITLDYDDNAGTAFRVTDEMDGFRLGAGAEFPITKGIAVRAEYRFSDYGEYRINGVGSGVDVRRNQGVVTLIAKF